MPASPSFVNKKPWLHVSGSDKNQATLLCCYRLREAMVAVKRFFDQTSRHDILKIRRKCNTIVHMRLEKRQIYECYEDQLRSFKCVSSAVECRTRNRESAGSNSIPLLPFRNLGIFVLATTPRFTQLYK